MIANVSPLEWKEELEYKWQKKQTNPWPICSIRISFSIFIGPVFINSPIGILE
jgi:hypothetical protein